MIAAVVVNAVTGLSLLGLPYQSSTITATSGGRSSTRSGTATLLEANGPSVIIPLLIPVLVAALPLLALGKRASVVSRGTAAALLVAFVMLGAMSVGIFYLPSALLMAIAALMSIRPPVETPDGV